MVSAMLILRVKLILLSLPLLLKLPHLKRAIVEQLPEVGAADTNTIYMVGTGEGSETSVYKRIHAYQW